MTARKRAKKKSAPTSVSINRVAYRLRAAAHRMEVAAKNVRTAVVLLEKNQNLEGGSFTSLMRISAKDTLNAAEYLAEKKYLQTS